MIRNASFGLILISVLFSRIHYASAPADMPGLRALEARAQRQAEHHVATRHNELVCAISLHNKMGYCYPASNGQLFAKRFDAAIDADTCYSYQKKLELKRLLKKHDEIIKDDGDMKTDYKAKDEQTNASQKLINEFIENDQSVPAKRTLTIQACLVVPKDNKKIPRSG